MIPILVLKTENKVIYNKSNLNCKTFFEEFISNKCSIGKCRHCLIYLSIVGDLLCLYLGNLQWRIFVLVKCLVLGWRLRQCREVGYNRRLIACWLMGVKYYVESILALWMSAGSLPNGVWLTSHWRPAVTNSPRVRSLCQGVTSRPNNYSRILQSSSN